MEFFIMCLCYVLCANKAEKYLLYLTFELFCFQVLEVVLYMSFHIQPHLKRLKPQFYHICPQKVAISY